MTIQIRNGRFCVQVYHPTLKRKVWIGTYPDRALAEIAETETKEAMAGRGPGGDTWDSFARRWHIDWARPAVATRKTQKYAVVRFAEQFEGVPLNALDYSEARLWARTQPVWVTDVLRTMVNDARDVRLYLGDNPFASMRRSRPRGRKDIEVLTLDELYALADCAASVWGEWGRLVFRPMIIFAAFVICRPQELYFLERRQIVGGDEIRILWADDSTGNPKRPKDGNPRSVIIAPPAAEAISVVPPRIDVPWLFYKPGAENLRRAVSTTTGIRSGCSSAGPDSTSTNSSTSVPRTCSTRLGSSPRTSASKQVTTTMGS
jgi:integrase